MARARKADSPNDGMTWLALMPFPAFAPQNWWALTSPRNAMLATLNNTRLALDAWRASTDGFRALVRLQQNEMIKMLEAPLLAEPVEAAAEPPAQPEATEKAQDPALLVEPMFNPMLEATRAYSRVGRAFIVAQRDTLRAFAPPPADQH